MSKVYIDRDSHLSFFMWDKPVLDILNSGDRLHLVDVPEDFIKRYNEYLTLHCSIQEELEKFYEIKRANYNSNRKE